MLKSVRCEPPPGSRRHTAATREGGQQHGNKCFMSHAFEDIARRPRYQRIGTGVDAGSASGPRPYLTRPSAISVSCTLGRLRTRSIKAWMLGHFAMSTCNFPVQFSTVNR